MSSSTAEQLSDATSAAVRTCPACGQHVDRSNIRCPRCRAWFVAPPTDERWSPLAIGAAVTALAVASYVLAGRLLF
jgi:predicted RNA-binding Zn-ribbon protein involved in translation (DUF1610 family)